MDTFIDITLIVVGFLLLIKGADFLVSGASSLAKQFNVSNLAIGLTIVAMGTSAPELVVNLIGSQAGTENDSDIVFGNIIGSNIFNLYLILGIASVIFPLSVQKKALLKDVPYALGALLLLLVMVNDKLLFGASENTVGLWDGLILSALFVTFIVHTFLQMGTQENTEEGDGAEEIKVYSGMKSLMFVILGLVGLVFGGNFAVTHAVSIAQTFGVSEQIIGLTILAGGTSLPELATTCVAAFQRKADLAIGNIIGSNIFNILLVLGTTASIASTKKALIFDTRLNFDLLFTVGGMVLLILFMFTFGSKKIDRSEGFIFLLGFLVYGYILYTRL